jgi:hypothetical protein
VRDEFDTIFDCLDRDNAVLVGEPNRQLMIFRTKATAPAAELV